MQIPCDLRRTWLFGPGSDPEAHKLMAGSQADVLIVDLEDFTPEPLRARARQDLPALLQQWRSGGHIAAVRINQLEGDGPADLAAAMMAGCEIVAYPMASTAAQMTVLHALVGEWERTAGIEAGITEILPVCETAVGVADVRAIAQGSPRIRAALLGAEDLAADLCAERQPDALELEYARRRFLLECRAAGIEPIDAPFTFSDVEAAAQETRHSRRLGYRAKAVVRPEHVQAINQVLTPSDDHLRRAGKLVSAFEDARAAGRERALVDGSWVEVPTYRNAQRLIERGYRLRELQVARGRAQQLTAD